MKPSARVFLIEDHEVTRRALREVLHEEGFTIAGEAGSVAVARALLPRTEFDIALVDLYLRDGEGTEVVELLRQVRPEAPIVMLTASDSPDDLLRALRAGASGYLTKDMSPGRLGDTLRAARAGEAPLPRRMARVLVDEVKRDEVRRRRRGGTVTAQLTPREREVIELLSEGRRTGEIAAELYISVETVRSHVKAVMRKLGVHTRAAAVARLEELHNGR